MIIFIITRRLAVAAAQRAADLAEARANDACSELCSIKAELLATQQQLAGLQAAAAQATPMAMLRTKLQGVQDALAGLHNKHTEVAALSPSVDAKVQGRVNDRLMCAFTVLLCTESAGLVGPGSLLFVGSCRLYTHNSIALHYSPS
jgi:hypothetical protein